MRKILFTLLILLVSCKSEQMTKPTVKEKINSVSKHKNPNYTELREFKGDTLKYLQSNFLKNQNFYIGKKFSTVLNDLELDVKFYYYGQGGDRLDKCVNFSINFYDRNQKSKKLNENKDPLVLYVVWEVPLPLAKTDELLRKNKAQWTEEEREYYGQQTIKEIGMVVPNY